MKTLDRYILRELVVPFLIGTIAVTLMFQANTVIFLQKSYNLQHVPLSAIFQLLAYHTPEFLNQTLPVGVSLASSLAISRLARESELTAMRGAGASLRRILLPVWFFGLLVAVGSYFNVERVMPAAQSKASRVEQDLFAVMASPVFRSNVSLTLDRYSVWIGGVTRGPNDSLQLANIMLIESPHPDDVWIYKAVKGTYHDGDWILDDAIFYEVKGVSLVAVKAHQPVRINERIPLGDFFAPSRPKEQTSQELLAAISAGKKTGIQTQALELEYNIRFSLPAACIVFAVVAPVFAIGFAKTGGFIGVLLSIVLAFAYYNVYVITTEILGRNSAISPVIAAWLPNVIFGALGIWGLRRLE